MIRDAGDRTPDIPLADDPVISIGVFAERAGLSVSAIRKYESEGVLLAHRTPGGHRLFSHQDLQRVEVIQHLIQDLGLNFEGIRRMEALLPCWRLLPCDDETRRDCPAFLDLTGPCWTNRPPACEERGRECRTCIAYRLGSLCANEIKRLIHEPSECRTGNRTVRALLDRVEVDRFETPG